MGQVDLARSIYPLWWVELKLEYKSSSYLARVEELSPRASELKSQVHKFKIFYIFLKSFDFFVHIFDWWILGAHEPFVSLTSEPPLSLGHNSSRNELEQSMGRALMSGTNYSVILLPLFIINVLKSVKYC